jgi:hypothetical protein
MVIILKFSSLLRRFGSKLRDFEDICKVGTKGPSEMKRGITLGTILWKFITCFHVSAKVYGN